MAGGASFATEPFGCDCAVRIEGISKTFPGRLALCSVSLSVRQGEILALIGPSGSGKSTLLRHVSGLLAADAGGGSVTVHGRTIQSNGVVARDIRRQRAGVAVVFQQFNLVGRLSLLDNVLLGMLSRVPTWRTLPRLFSRGERREAMNSLERVGMAEYAGQRASTLSGGQQQRGAIARAIVQQAKVILADEPIASLDPRSSQLVMETLGRLNREDGTTVLVSLHQIEHAFRHCPRTVALQDGKVVYDGPTEGLTAERLRGIYGARLAEFCLADDPTFNASSCWSSTLAAAEPKGGIGLLESQSVGAQAAP